MAFHYIDYSIQYTNVIVDLKSFTTLDSPPGKGKVFSGSWENDISLL